MQEESAFSRASLQEQETHVLEEEGLISRRGAETATKSTSRHEVFELGNQEDNTREVKALRKPIFCHVRLSRTTSRRLCVFLYLVVLVTSFSFGFFVSSIVGESNGRSDKLQQPPNSISKETSPPTIPNKQDKISAPDSKSHYLYATEKERSDVVWRFINQENTELHYWDRRTKFQIMSSCVFSFFRGTASLYWYDFGQDTRLNWYGSRADNVTNKVLKAESNRTSAAPRTKQTMSATPIGSLSTWTWLSGDCHIYNFGSMGSNEKEVHYGLNDFDDSIYCDYQLDLWRLGVSIVMITRSNNAHAERSLKWSSSRKIKKENVNDDDLKDILLAMSSAYIQQMRYMADKKSQEADSSIQADAETSSQMALTKENTYGVLKSFLSVVEQKYSRTKMLDKWAPQTRVETSNFTSRNHEERQFDLSNPKLGSVTLQERETLEKVMIKYFSDLEEQTSRRLKHQPKRQSKSNSRIVEYGNKPTIRGSSFTILDVARRLDAGTGSLGCDRFYLLVEDAVSQQVIVRMLDVKEQHLPAPYQYTFEEARSIFDKEASADGLINAAQGVVLATSKLSTVDSNSIKFVGTLSMKDKHFSIMERSPFKSAFPALHEDAVKKFKNVKLLVVQDYKDFVTQLASVLASHHVLASPRHETTHEPTTSHHSTAESFERSILKMVNATSDREEKFHELICNISLEYAEQVEKDWLSFQNNLGIDMKSTE